MAPKGYRYPKEFPREAFVQSAIERHFLEHGFETIKGGHTDLACRHPATGERWIIEAKGETADVGLDFRTGLGQIVQQFSDPSTLYGIAVPETAKFLRQCARLSKTARGQLNLHVLLVQPSGEVAIIPPSTDIPG